MNSLQACKYTKVQIYSSFVLIQIPCNSSDAGQVTPAEHVAVSGSTATQFRCLCTIIDSRETSFALKETSNITSHSFLIEQCRGNEPWTAAEEKPKPSLESGVTCRLGAPYGTPIPPEIPEDQAAIRIWHGSHRHWGRCRAERGAGGDPAPLVCGALRADRGAGGDPS